MFKKLKHIAFAFTWLSLFTLLLHSFIPHHHHDSDIHHHHAENFHHGSVIESEHHTHEHSNHCNGKCSDHHCFNDHFATELNCIPVKFKITAEISIIREDIVFLPIINILNIDHDVNQLYSSPPSLFKTRGPPSFII